MCVCVCVCVRVRVRLRVEELIVSKKPRPLARLAVDSRK
jgi:hypothetical protein